MPALGALADPDSRSTTFRVWAPLEPDLRLRVHGSGHTYHHEMIGGMFRLAAIQAAVLDDLIQNPFAVHLSGGQVIRLDAAVVRQKNDFAVSGRDERMAEDVTRQT